MRYKMFPQILSVFFFASTFESDLFLFQAPFFLSSSLSLAVLATAAAAEYQCMVFTSDITDVP